MLIVNLDVMLARRKMSVTELAQRVGITLANISILEKRQGKGHSFFPRWRKSARCWNASPGIF